MELDRERQKARHWLQQQVYQYEHELSDDVPSKTKQYIKINKRPLYYSKR